MTDWNKKQTDLIDAMKAVRTPITIEFIMAVYGYASKASAEYALHKLEKMGVVECVDRKWYLIAPPTCVVRSERSQ